MVVGLTFFYQSWNHRKSELPTNSDYWDEGYVLYPNVDVVVEMANLINAQRSYEANAAAVAAYLASHDQVERVQYAGLADSPWHARADALQVIDIGNRERRGCLRVFPALAIVLSE